jgi:hypothetical protein
MTAAQGRNNRKRHVKEDGHVQEMKQKQLGKSIAKSKTKLMMPSDKLSCSSHWQRDTDSLARDLLCCLQIWLFGLLIIIGTSYAIAIQQGDK